MRMKRNWIRRILFSLEQNETGYDIFSFVSKEKTLDTPYLLSFKTKRNKKRCFRDLSQRGGPGNSVSGLTQQEGKALPSVEPPDGNGTRR